MDYQEVIKELKSLNKHCFDMIDKEDKESIWRKDCEALDVAISAMQELQEYKQLGTLEEMKLLKATHLTGVESAQILCAIKQLTEYEKIGNLEEVREAVEKQKEERPIAVLGTFGGEEYECKNCGSSVDYMDEYCKWCGKAQDWSDKG